MPSKRKSTRPTKHTKKAKTDELETPAPPADEADGSGDGIEVTTKVLKETSKLGEKWNMKIVSWNVDGLRAWVKKGGLQFFKDENPDVVCLQEIKCSEKQLPSEAKIDGYHMFWCSGKTEGYAGVGLYSKIKPLDVKLGIDVEEHDQEGRVITAEYEKFFLVNTYVPNSGRGLKTLDYRMQWDSDFHAYISKLAESKSVILCGDLNVAHNEIDLANPKTNTKNAGFTKEERESFSKFLDKGYVDTFRYLYPEEKGAYTFWTYMRNSRSKNVGWRLDYFVVSSAFVDNICDNVILNKFMGSDHCPIALYLTA